MAVKIDMDMPKNCMYCQFCFALKNPETNRNYYWCTAGQHEVNGKRKRYKSCPLQEVKE